MCIVCDPPELCFFVWIYVFLCVFWCIMCEFVCICVNLCVYLYILCVIVWFCVYNVCILCIYASQIRVPNWRPRYASQIDVPIRVPNELFIKVQSVTCVCIRVPDWGVYTRPELVCIYASQIVGYIRVPVCIYASRMSVSIVYICVFLVCFMCIYGVLWIFCDFFVFLFLGYILWIVCIFLFFSFDCMRISHWGYFEWMRFLSIFIDFFVYFDL